SLEIKQVRQLDRKGAFTQLMRESVPGVVINDEQVAERMMNELEADVGADHVRIRVVLNERVQKCPGSESGNEFRADQLCSESAVREVYCIAVVSQIHGEV